MKRFMVKYWKNDKLQQRIFNAASKRDLCTTLRCVLKLEVELISEITC